MLEPVGSAEGSGLPSISARGIKKRYQSAGNSEIEECNSQPRANRDLVH